MAKQARYSIEIPQQDLKGNSLGTLPFRVHSLLHDRGVTKKSQISGSHRRIVGKDHQQMHSLSTILDDTPEHDSHIKETARYVGEASNHPEVYATKESGQGIQEWVIKNPHHDPKMPAPLSQARTTYPQNPESFPHYQGKQAFD